MALDADARKRLEEDLDALERRLAAADLPTDGTLRSNYEHINIKGFEIGSFPWDLTGARPADTQIARAWFVVSLIRAFPFLAADIRALLSELDRIQGGEGRVLVPREPGIGYKAALAARPDEPG